MHVINRTDNECWFGVVLSLPKDSKTDSHSKDLTFLTHVSNAEFVDFQIGPKNHFKVFGNHLLIVTNQELSFYVHNILNQLLPIIQVRLYEFVLSKLSSSTSHFAVEKNVFLPGSVHLKRTIMTKRDTVIVRTRAEPDDFESFSTDEKGRTTFWMLSYDETAVVDKRTGMVNRGDMSLSVYIPISSDFTPGGARKPVHGLEVSFRSTVESVDESEANVKSWREMLKKEKDFNQPLNLPSVKESLLLYFAPSKGSPQKKPVEDIKEIIKLSENSQGRSIKLPPMIKIEQHSPVNADESDRAENDYENDNYDDELSDETDDDDYSENDNDDDENVPYWPQPNYAPYGIGYEVKRKRSVIARRSQIIKKAAGKSPTERKISELDAIWDEITSSAPDPIREPPRVIRSSIFGFDFLAEIEYSLKATDQNENDNDDDSDNDNDEDWSVTTSYRITLGQYRISAFSKTRTLSTLRSKLPQEGQRKTTRWPVDAGDFVMCVPLFYFQRLCGAIRLTFDMTVSYSLPRLSLSYPVELNVHIEQKVTTNATLSGYASTWFYESGFYTKGTLAMATLPVRLSFKEDTSPEWCVNGNLEQKMVRIDTVPRSSWNCSLDFLKLADTCHGLPATNTSLVTFDLHYSSTEGTMFDNWHYPVSCVHQKVYSPY
ncbi:hypothetical protein AWC38_SpisGene2270 [Stylophora pistillata]|uniref:Uncharacterized protein n=2 Tax=Stylophora pistillata TaxID=50429 RepID=A0A2B4SU63_STYPI|nr:hypothetical protein AWC38_SpisGene2270 [Stylophora pistillata]